MIKIVIHVFLVTFTLPFLSAAAVPDAFVPQLQIETGRGRKRTDNVATRQLVLQGAGPRPRRPHARDAVHRHRGITGVGCG